MSANLKVSVVNFMSGWNRNPSSKDVSFIQILMDREDSSSGDEYVDEREVMSDDQESLSADLPVRKQWKLSTAAIVALL